MDIFGDCRCPFVRSLNAKRKSHKNFGNDKKNRGNKTGKGGYGADTGSDKESRKKTRNRKKQRGHNAKHRHASKSDTSLEDIKNFEKKKRTKSVDSNNSFNGSDLEENKQKHNRTVLRLHRLLLRQLFAATRSETIRAKMTSFLRV